MSWSCVVCVQATSQLVNALKTEAESQSDSEQQKKLLAAAKLLADATARMVEAAKVWSAIQVCHSPEYYINNNNNNSSTVILAAGGFLRFLVRLER